MGLFDQVRFQYPLPDPEVQEETFQTKDLGKAMDNYTVARDGKLIRHPKRFERVERVSKPSTLELVSGSFPGWPGFDPSSDEPVDGFSETITAYTDYEGVWFEYRLEFLGGRLREIERLPEDEAEAEERMQHYLRQQAEIEIAQKNLEAVMAQMEREMRESPQQADDAPDEAN